jgi:hypothetical protein
MWQVANAAGQCSGGGGISLLKAASLATSSEAAASPPSSCRPADGRDGCIRVLHAAVRVQVKVQVDQQHCTPAVWSCIVDCLGVGRLAARVVTDGDRWS